MRQPLAGEVAARRELLEALPFATGYGVEIAMLIDVWRDVGLDGLAQVDLERAPQPPPAARGALADGRHRARHDRPARWSARGACTESSSTRGPLERPPLAELGVA